VSPGGLETWVLKGKKGGEQNYEKIWCRAFKSPAWSLSWNAEMSYLIVGCDDGTIVPIEIDVESPMQYTELREYKVHKSTVIGTHILTEKNQMYSVGEDKYLRVFDFKSKQVVNNN
jgi:hypothetical protein